ncbi:hypothetical protein KQH82_04365 [bacterium]|nr:hypothetical protein [bacterium]
MKKGKSKSRPRPMNAIKQAVELQRMGNLYEARDILEAVIAKLTGAKQVRQRVEALSVLSDLWRDTEDSGKAMTLLKEALKLANRNGIVDLECDLIRKRAFLNLLLERYSESMADAFTALKVSRANEFEHMEADALAMIGHLHEVRKERPKALVWFREAMVLATKSKYHWRQSGLHHDLGRIHGELREYLTALDYLERGEQFAKKHGFRPHYLMMVRARGDIYKAIGDLGRAQKLYEHSLSDPQKMDYPSQTLENSTRLGDLYIELGEYDKATTIFREGAAIAKRFRYKRKLLQNYFGIALSYVKKDQFLRAFGYYKSIFRHLKDDFENRLSMAIAALEMCSFVLEKLDQHKLAKELEDYWKRFQALDDEGTYTALRRKEVRNELIKEMPRYLEKILNWQFGIYEVGDLSVNLKTGVIKLKRVAQPEPLKDAELIAFRFLHESLDEVKTFSEIYNSYSKVPDYGAKGLQGRVRTLMDSIRNKGIPKTLLRNVRGVGYVLVSKYSA